MDAKVISNIAAASGALIFALLIILIIKPTDMMSKPSHTKLI
jgi:hypothetical protein